MNSTSVLPVKSISSLVKTNVVTNNYTLSSEEALLAGLLEEGDVITAKINDFTMLGERFKHAVRGTILKVYRRAELRGYDVKLFQWEDFEGYVPYPLTEEYKNYPQPDKDPAHFNQLEVIFVNHEDVVRHCCKARLDTITFREALTELWKNLIFREVKAVIKQPSDLTSVEYVYLDETGCVRERTFNSLKEAFAQVPKKFHRNIRGRYNAYYGFTTRALIRANDPYANSEIFFSKKCHAEINLGYEPTGRFGRLNSELTWPPRTGQLICGLVEKGEKGLFYRKWFVCSRQFLTLWTMLCYSKHPSFTEKGQVKSFNQMMLELDTQALRPNLSQPIKEQQDKFRIFNIEYSAAQWSDRYQDIAKLAFPLVDVICNERKNGGEEVKEIDKVDQPYPLKTFKELFTKEVLWMLD